jgi:uncharacterized protein YcbX
MPRVTDLFVHPLKGAAPVRVQRLRLDARGAVGDRRWLLVNDQGVALTQREVPRLALIHAELPMHDGAVVSDAPLTLHRRGAVPLVVPPAAPDAPLRVVRVWADEQAQADAGDAAAEWCTDAVGVTCRLLHLTSASHRALAAKYAGPLDAAGREVSVTDGAPLLLLGAASLDALNARLTSTGSAPLGVERFRPNVLLGTTAPHEEDRWERIRIGEVEIGVGSPCPRCVVTTIDQHTLAQGVEPLRTLALYRRAASGGVMFGMNATHAHGDAGEIRVGDDVTVLAHRAGDPLA